MENEIDLPSVENVGGLFPTKYKSQLLKSCLGY